jgi:Na+-transporting NADH:ubiquinone oxidoreductase subunit B
MSSIVTWQPPMKRVLIGLAPATAASVWFFGLRALVVITVVCIAGFLTEYVFGRFLKQTLTSSVFVTCLLFSLSLPPSIPLWIAVVGVVFGIVFGKIAFGGFGRNIYNPALVGRVFIYVSFASFMTTRWSAPATTSSGLLSLPFGPGGFTRYAVDATSSPTPLGIARTGGSVDVLSLLWGNVPGCLGETSAILIILGGLYIIWKKAANWRIVLTSFVSFLVFQSAFWLFGVKGASDPLSAVLSGGLVLGFFFMATDPVSAAQTQGGRWIYGALVGSLTALIRVFSAWPEGTMFAILLGNTFAPLVDYVIRRRATRASAAASAKAEPAAGDAGTTR